MNKGLILGAIVGAIAGKMLSGSKDGGKEQQKPSALDDWDAYADQLDREERAQGKTQDDDDVFEVFSKVGKGIAGALKSAGEQAKRQQEQRRWEMERDCDRMGRLERQMDDDFDQLEKEFERDFPKMPKW